MTIVTQKDKRDYYSEQDKPKHYHYDYDKTQNYIR